MLERIEIPVVTVHRWQMMAVLAAKWRERESGKDVAVGKKRSGKARSKDGSDTVSDTSERDTRTEASKLFAVPERKVRVPQDAAQFLSQGQRPVEHSLFSLQAARALLEVIW